MKKFISVIVACLTLIGMIIPFAGTAYAASSELPTSYSYNMIKKDSKNHITISVCQKASRYKQQDKWMLKSDTNKSGVIFAKRIEENGGQRISVEAKKAGTTTIVVGRYTYNEYAMTYSYEEVLAYKFVVEEDSSGNPYFANFGNDMLDAKACQLKYHKYPTSQEAFYKLNRSLEKINNKTYKEVLSFGERIWDKTPGQGIPRLMTVNAAHVHTYSNGKCSKCGLKQETYENGIPEPMYSACPRKGTTQELTINGKKLQVYLPYGYTKNKKYDVVVMLHGMNGSRNNWFVTEWKLFDRSGKIQGKQLLDWIIYKGDAAPFIAISGDMRIYNDDMGRSFSEYTKKLKNDWMPYIIENYSTYAKSSSEADIIAARDHFIIAGASYGGTAVAGIGIREDSGYLGKWFGKKIAISGGTNKQKMKNYITGSQFVSSNIIVVADGGTSDSSAHKATLSYKGYVPDGSIRYIEFDQRGHNWSTFLTGFLAGIQNTK